jgi:hypothetical protein
MDSTQQAFHDDAQEQRIIDAYNARSKRLSMGMKECGRSGRRTVLY